MVGGQIRRSVLNNVRNYVILWALKETLISFVVEIDLIWSWHWNTDPGIGAKIPLARKLDVNDVLTDLMQPVSNQNKVACHINGLLIKFALLLAYVYSVAPKSRMGGGFLTVCGMLFRSRFYLSSKTKLTLYYSLIYPYITYCNSTWSSTYVTNLNRIYCLQKHALRAITNSDYRAHSAPLFSKLKFLDIYQINTFHILKFMYCYRNNLLPSLFFNLFFTNSQTHGYSTRTANNHRIHHCRTNLKKFTILYQGPKIWNSLLCQAFPLLRKNCWSSW